MCESNLGSGPVFWSEWAKLAVKTEQPVQWTSTLAGPVNPETYKKLTHNIVTRNGFMLKRWIPNSSNPSDQEYEYYLATPYAYQQVQLLEQ